MGALWDYTTIQKHAKLTLYHTNNKKKYRKHIYAVLKEVLD